MKSLTALHGPAPAPGVAAASALALVGALGGLGIVALAAVSSQRALWSAGPWQVLRALAAAVGTGASMSVAAAALAGPLIAARRLVTSGEAEALAALGWGRGDVLRAWAPWALVAVALAAVAGGIVEPGAWRAVDGVKGSPALAAALWSQLRSGEVAVLDDGGAVVVSGERLRFTSGDGGWAGGAASLHPDGAGWALSGFEASGPDGSTWGADRLRLRLDRESSRRWAAPPRSPWAASPLALLHRRAEPRARRVLHRRLALVVAVLPLGILGLALGWSSRRGAPLLAPLAVGAVFLLARLGDGLGLPPVLSGWSPAALASILALLAWRATR